MDPIDLHSNELESFLGTYGSRSKLKRDSIKSNKSITNNNKIIGKGNSSLAIGTASQNASSSNNNSLPRVNKRTRTISENINNSNNNNNSKTSSNKNINTRFWKSQELRKFSAPSIIQAEEKEELSSNISITVNVDDIDDDDSKEKGRFSWDSTKLIEEESDEYQDKSETQADTDNYEYFCDEDGSGGGGDDEEDRKVEDEEEGMHQKNEEDDDADAEEKIEMGKRRHRFTGLALAFLSCIAFSLSSLIVKYLKDYHPFALSTWRFQGLVIPAIPMMLYVYFVRKDKIFNSVWPPSNKKNLTNIFYLMLRSTVGLATIILQFYALRYIPLADQMVLASSQPVLVSIVAFFLLGEPCGFVPIFISLLTMLGVGIVAKPPFLTGAESFDADTLKGSLLAMGSTMMSVLSIICMRRMATSHVHFTLITFTFGLWSTIFSAGAAVTLNVFELPRQEHILIAIVLICLVFISQTSTTLALQYEQAGPVSLTRGSNIVFAFLWQFIFLGVVPDLLSMLGAAIILLGVVTTAMRKWVSTLSKDHAARKKFGFILK